MFAPVFSLRSWDWSKQWQSAECHPYMEIGACRICDRPLHLFDLLLQIRKQLAFEEFFNREPQTIAQLLDR